MYELLKLLREKVVELGDDELREQAKESLLLLDPPERSKRLLRSLVRRLEETKDLKPAIRITDRVLDRALPTSKAIDTLKELAHVAIRKNPQSTIVFFEDYGTGKTFSMALIREIVEEKKASAVADWALRRKRRIDELKKLSKRLPREVREYLNELSNKHLSDIASLYSKYNAFIEELKLVYLTEEDMHSERYRYELIAEKLGIRPQEKYSKAVEEIRDSITGLILLIDEFDKRVIEHEEKIDAEVNFLRKLVEEAQNRNKRLLLVVSANKPISEEKRAKVSKALLELKKAITRKREGEEEKLGEHERFLLLLMLTDSELPRKDYEVDRASLSEALGYIRGEGLEGAEEDLRNIYRYFSVRLSLYREFLSEHALSAALFPVELLWKFKTKEGELFGNLFRSLSLELEALGLDDPHAHAIVKYLAIRVDVNKSTLERYLSTLEASKRLRKLIDKGLVAEKNRRLYLVLRSSKYLPEYMRKVREEHKRGDFKTLAKDILSFLRESSRSLELPEENTLESLEEFLVKKAKELLDFEVFNKPLGVLKPAVKVNVKAFLRSLLEEGMKEYNRLINRSEVEALDKLFIDALKNARKRLVAKSLLGYVRIITPLGETSVKEYKEIREKVLGQIEAVTRTISNKVKSRQPERIELLSEAQGVISEIYLDDSVLEALRESVSDALKALKKAGYVDEYAYEDYSFKLYYEDPREKERKRLQSEAKKLAEKFKTKGHAKIAPSYSSLDDEEALSIYVEEFWKHKGPTKVYIVEGDRIVEVSSKEDLLSLLREKHRLEIYREVPEKFLKRIISSIVKAARKILESHDYRLTEDTLRLEIEQIAKRKVPEEYLGEVSETALEHLKSSLKQRAEQKQEEPKEHREIEIILLIGGEERKRWKIKSEEDIERILNELKRIIS